VKDIAKSRSNIPVSINALDEPGRRGKHIALDHDCEQQILDWTQQNAEEDTSVTRGEIMDYCPSQCKIKLTQ
jgi:hypothetical protein